jgi:hypothetical protein
MPAPAGVVCTRPHDLGGRDRQPPVPAMHLPSDAHSMFTPNQPILLPCIALQGGGGGSAAAVPVSSQPDGAAGGSTRVSDSEGGGGRGRVEWLPGHACCLARQWNVVGSETHCWHAHIVICHGGV